MSIVTWSRWAASAASSCLAVLLFAAPGHVRADIPDLAVSKQILSANETIDAGELIHYVTGLRFTGAEEKAFSVVEVIREPLAVRGLVELTVQTGQVSTPRVTVETRRNSDGINETVVRWRGTMTAGETRIQLSMPVRAEVACRPDQSQVLRQSLAVITALDGSNLRTSSSRNFTVQCPPMASINDLEVDLSLKFPDEAAAAQLGGARITDNHDRYANQVLLQATLTNHGNAQAAVGVLLGLRPVESAPPDASDRYAPILLQPGETRRLDVWTDMRPHAHPDHALNSRGENDPAAVTNLEAGIHFVLLSPLLASKESVRPHPAAEIHAVTRPLSLRGWDLGDAPSSDNRFETPMEAYPGVQAHFPTVFDVAAEQASGPAHAQPRLLHLGRSFSLEADADLGPNASIEPTHNRADLDEHDDATQPSAWPLNHCQPTDINVQIFISPDAVAWFGDQPQTAYLNAWLDVDRDGQWSGVLSCPNGDSLEHIIIDHPVDVAALGPGYHTVRVPTGRIHWPPELAQQPAWARLTLSEEPSVKTATAGLVEYGDGRGPGYPWQFGETEDFLLRPPGQAGAGPDLEVRLHGSSRAITDSEQTRFIFTRLEFMWTMEYTNIGSKVANPVTGFFQFPEFITQEQIETGATFTLLKARRNGQITYQRLKPNEVIVNGNLASWELTRLAPGEQGRLLVHFTAELDDESNNTRGIADDPLDWTVQAGAITPGDINPNNRIASFSEVSGLSVLGALPERSRIAVRSPTSPFWVPRGTTNQSTLNMQGMLPTGETLLYIGANGDYYEAPIADKGFVNIWLQIIETSDELEAWVYSKEYLAPGVYVEEVSFQSNGHWELQLTNLPNAHYRVAVGDPRACDNITSGLGGDEIAWILNGRPMVDNPRELPGTSGRRGIALSSCAHFTVDRTLPIDPMSLGFFKVPANEPINFDFQQPVILPNTLGFSRGDWSVRLPPSADQYEYIAVFALHPLLANSAPRLVDRYGDQSREIAVFETAISNFYRTERFLFDEADALFGAHDPLVSSTAGGRPRCHCVI
jgi:hypothetical protein